MKSLNFNSKWVLVTGASSGLGKEIAQQLAYQHKANLIITARRADRLNKLKAELEQSGIEVKVLVADLSLTADADRLLKICTEGEGIYAAILNAGVTYFGLQKDITESSLRGFCIPM